MQLSQLCYWLQGAFELSDIKTISQGQVAIIRAHLEMVKIHDSESLKSGFGKWICDAFLFASFADGGYINEAGTSRICEELGLQFLHELDKKFPVDQNIKLDVAHAAPAAMYGKPKPLMRC